MNTKLLAFASALVATTVLASAAEAGGGVRLGFGGPLGTFVATPAHRGDVHVPTVKRKALVLHAVRKPVKPASRVAKLETPKPAPKAVVEKTEPATDETPRATGNSTLIQSSIQAEQEGATKPDVKAEVSSETTVTASDDKVRDTQGNCTKFIPAVGMTVKVGCGE